LPIFGTTTFFAIALDEMPVVTGLVGLIRRLVFGEPTAEEVGDVDEDEGLEMTSARDCEAVGCCVYNCA
jgi:hypothetical protein